MKRLFALAIIFATIAMLGTANADSPRKVLFEHFTNAGCGPCASSAPAYYGYLKQNLDKVIPISYHTSGPGSDVMYSHNPTMNNAQSSRYNITAVPTLILNGKSTYYRGAPAPTSNYESKVSQITSEMSPITLQVNKQKSGVSNNVTISVNSSKKYLQLALRVAVVEAYHHYENAGSNGEKEFYFIARQMLPSTAGTLFKIDPNETKQFEFSFDDDAEWYPSMVFVVAWVQNDNDSDVLQVESSPIPNLQGIEDAQPVKFNLASAQQASKVAELETVSKQITVTNPHTFSMKSVFVVNEGKSNYPGDWSATIEPSEAVIPAGGSATINLKVTTGATSALGTFNVAAIPVDVSGGLPITSTYNMYLLSGEVKYAIFDNGMGYYAPYLYNGLLEQSIYGQNVALLPFNATVASVFTPDDFEVAFFMTTSPYEGVSFLMPDQVNYIKSMMSKGKNVFVASDASGAVSQIAQAPDEVRLPLVDFYTNVAQVNIAGSKSWLTQSGTQIQINSFTVNGVDQDTVTGNFVATFNQTNQMYLFASFSDMFSIPSGSPAKSIASYNGNPAEIAGIRVEKSNGAKLVLLGFPLEATNNVPMMRTMLNNSMRWFVGAPEVIAPEIETEFSTLQFGQVEIGKSTEKTFEVYNFGNADLIISQVSIRNDDDGVFTVVDNEMKTIAPDDFATYTVRFTPKDEKVYTFADVVLFNNDPYRKNYPVALNGAGILPAASGPRAKLSAESISFPDVLSAEFIDREIIITNTGVQNLLITELNIENDASEAFKIISLPPSAIAPSGTYRLQVRFNPPVEGNYTANVKFRTNTDVPFYEIPLAGKGLHNSSVNDGIYGNDALSMQVGPNPFANSTNLRFNIAGYVNQDVQISLLDASGKQVALIVNGTIAPGEHNVKFDGSFLPSGTYYVVAKIGSKTATMPVAIVK